eukprot:389043-Prorocentrum_minimum.AAC.1
MPACDRCEQIGRAAGESTWGTGQGGEKRGRGAMGVECTLARRLVAPVGPSIEVNNRCRVFGQSPEKLRVVVSTLGRFPTIKAPVRNRRFAVAKGVVLRPLNRTVTLCRARFDRAKSPKGTKRKQNAKGAKRRLCPCRALPATRARTHLGGELNSPVAEWLKKGL